MELIIINEFDKKEKIIKDPKFIPRIGEQVIWDYEPAPKVTRVGYHLDKEIVVVTIE